MNKNLLLIIGAVLTLGLIVFIIVKILTLSTSQPQTSSALPIGPSNTQTSNHSSSSNNSGGQGSTTDTLSIATSNGGTIQTKDFLRDPVTVEDPINKGYYFIGYHVYEGVPDPTVTKDPPYVIEYIASTQFFNIALAKEPIKETRQQAEQFLITHLSISPDQMCQLNYSVGVANSVNQIYSGRNLGFSFCSGSTQL